MIISPNIHKIIVVLTEGILITGELVFKEILIMTILLLD